MVACARARVLVTLALLAEAGLLAVGTPAVGVACALARHVVTVAVGEALAFALAVRAPELGWALCITTGSEISMATATFIGPDAHLILLTGKVPYTKRCQTFIA